MKVRSDKEAKTPILINGDLYVDKRGEVGFVNGFDMAPVRRFYTLVNHKPGFVRAWHAHRKEAKFVTVVSGAAIIAAVKIDNWEKPSKDSKVYRFILSSKKPAVVLIPEGYANGSMETEEGTKIMVFSTRTVEESRADDVKYDSYYWNPWQVSS